MEIINRKEAKAQGLKHYFTNKPCIKGHTDKRRTLNGYCLLCEKAFSLARYNKNKEEIIEKQKLYVKNNRHIGRAACSRYFQKNKLKARFRRNKRRAIKLSATPLWVSLEKIKEVYLNCPAGMEVDHIVPLQGKNVCGLHVENNLQYLTKEDNVRKSNTYNYR